MNFYDTVTEKGYKVVNMNEIIEIIKDDDELAETHITFYKDEKKIIGFVHTIKDIFDVDDMSHLYTIYLNMHEDLKYFAERSKYKII